VNELKQGEAQSIQGLAGKAELSDVIAAVSQAEVSLQNRGRRARQGDRRLSGHHAHVDLTPGIASLALRISFPSFRVDSQQPKGQFPPVDQSCHPRYRARNRPSSRSSWGRRSFCWRSSPAWAISLLQALTQMQEMTLSFVPKILAILLLAHHLPALHADHAPPTSRTS